MPRGSTNARRIAFLGPAGTFTEEALLNEPDLAEAELVAAPTIGDAIAAAESGAVDGAFVPIENSIEGTVAATLDHLVFEADLLIQRESVLDVHLHLLAPPGAALSDIRRVVSFPHAMAQCRTYIARALPGVETIAANSTADAARRVAEGAEPGVAAIAPLLSGKLYGLTPLASGIEDHPDNQTRFVLVAPGRVPPATGHDRTSLVCFQYADRPGSLHQILGQFAARSINLSKIESRPTKRGLGDYCFIIDFDGHVKDEVVGDCLRELHASLSTLKFLGSYPAAGDHGPAQRAAIEEARRLADDWLGGIRGLITSA